MKVDPATALSAKPAEHSVIMAELRTQGALRDFKTILCCVLLEAANAEVQELSLRDDIPAEYMANALHKCGVFSQAMRLLDHAEVSGGSMGVCMGVCREYPWSMQGVSMCMGVCREYPWSMQGVSMLYRPSDLFNQQMWDLIVSRACTEHPLF